MKLDPKIVRDQILALLAVNPELQEDDILRADMIEGSTTAFEFLSQVVSAIGSSEATIEGLDAYIKRLQQRQNRFERRIMALRGFIKSIMDAANMQKVPLDIATLLIRNGAPKVMIINEAEIPDDFMRIKREPDKLKIKAALIDHQHVQGAALSNGEPSLTILTR